MIDLKEVKIFLTFFLVFAFFAQWVSWNEYSRFALTKAIVEEGVFNIDSFSNETGDRAYYGNHYYSDKPPGLSFLSAPVYSSWKIFYDLVYGPIVSRPAAEQPSLKYFDKGVAFEYIPNPGNFILVSMFLITVLTSSFFSALTVLLLYKVLGFFTKKEWHKVLIAVVYGLATLAFPHSLVFTSHATGTFFGVLSLLLILKFKENTGRKELLLLAGIFLGVGIYTDGFVLLLCIPFWAYVFWSHKRTAMILPVGALMALLPLLIYNYSISGNPIFDIASLKYIDTAPIPYALKTALDESSSTTPIQGLSNNFLSSMYIVPQMLIFPSKGLFFYYPVLLFSIIGLFYMYKENRLESLLIAFLFIAFLLMIPLMAFVWWGSFSGFGLRYILPAVPFLTIPLVTVLKKIGVRILILPICLSVLVNFLLLQYGEDTIGMMSPSDYMKKLENFQVLSNPLLDHYLPLSIANGPRSVLFENLLLKGVIDIRFTPHSCGLTPPVLQENEIPVFAAPPLGVVVLRLPFLCLVPIGLAVLFIWKDGLFGRLEFTPRKKLLLLVCSVLIFIFLFVRVSEFAQGENWYDAQFQNGVLNGWMSQNSTLLLFNSRAETAEETLSFRVQPFYRTRTLQVYVKDELFFEGVIENETWIKCEISLAPGLNTVTLKSLEGCDIPTEVGTEDCDLRCLSFKIDDLQVISGRG